MLGVGVYQDFHLLTTETFKESILKAVEDPKIARKAKEVARLFKDKPQKPLETAVWWVEYVIRNPKLDNLRSPTLTLGTFVSQSYDILLVVIVAIHFIVYVLVKFVNILMKFNQKKSKTE